ncbi:MAG: metal-sensitive transcriptional regulator [Tissierellia bacterium]|nr:metal-sensitive transcriptional regulator [Tissierellia bacterium]MDD4725795.1 metal-sensitive transcriptional regulator [Tissierellia bacterium]
MNDKRDIIIRLRKIEGQVKGIQKMIDEEQYCGDILIQIASVRSALNNVGGLVLENYMHKCLNIDEKENKVDENDLNKLIDIMLKYTKQR